MKKLLALFLAAAMCLMLLAACGSSADDTAAEETAAEPAAEETAETEEQEEPTEPAEEEPAEETEEPAEEETEDIVEINMWLSGCGGNYTDIQQIEDLVNEKTEAEIGVHVNLTEIDLSEYNTQLPMAIAAGEVIDIACITPMPGTSFSTLYAAGQMMDLTELFPEYAPELYEENPNLSSFSVNGTIYGFSAPKSQALYEWVHMRKDVLDELGLTEYAQGMETWEDLEELFAQVAENTDLYPIGSSASAVIYVAGYDPNPAGMTSAEPYCTLDSLYVTKTDMDGNVSSIYDDEGWIWSCQKVAEWYNEGYVYPDSAITTDAGDTLMANNQIFSFITSGDFNNQITHQNSTGYELVSLKIAEGITGGSNLWGNFIPITSEEPEAAMKFLNYTMRSSEMINLLVYGVEGEDYVITETGEADYPEGEDSTTVGYHSSKWLFGNYFLIQPWAGEGADYNERAKTADEEAVYSPFIGFNYDTADLADLVGAVTEVQSEYAVTLSAGMYTEDAYNEFIQKLKDAGLDDYISNLQSQLNDWLANQ